MCSPTWDFLCIVFVLPGVRWASRACGLVIFAQTLKMSGQYFFKYTFFFNSHFPLPLDTTTGLIFVLFSHVSHLSLSSPLSLDEHCDYVFKFINTFFCWAQYSVNPPSDSSQTLAIILDHLKSLFGSFLF